MARALQQRWPLTAEQRDRVIGMLLGVIDDPVASHREKTSAARALLSAESQNQADEHKVLDGVTDRNSQLSKIAIDLGIDPSLIVDATGQADRSVASIVQHSDR